MGVQNALVAPARTQDPLQRTNVTPPAETVSTFIRELKDTGVTGVGLFLNFWQAGPYIVDPLYLTRAGDSLRERATTWAWGDVVWHYNDGTSAVYPAYNKVDWNRE